MQEPYLSIIIPAYNEEDRLPGTLDAILDYFAKAPQKIDYEIVVVDDGSTDGTLALAQKYAAANPRIAALNYGGNRGKGYAVKFGFQHGKGKYLLFSDSDLSTPIYETPKLLRKLEEGFGVAIASRYSPDAKLQEKQPPLRRFVRIGFNLLVKMILGLNFDDTQCGFKMLTRQSAEIIAPRMTITGFGFDPELLWLAKKYKLRTAEVGVIWINDPRSKVRVIRDSWRMFRDLIVIRMKDIKGVYK